MVSTGSTTRRARPAESLPPTRPELEVARGAVRTRCGRSLRCMRQARRFVAQAPLRSRHTGGPQPRWPADVGPQTGRTARRRPRTGTARRCTGWFGHRDSSSRTRAGGRSWGRTGSGPSRRSRHCLARGVAGCSHRPQRCRRWCSRRPGRSAQGRSWSLSGGVLRPAGTPGPRTRRGVRNASS